MRGRVIKLDPRAVKVQFPNDAMMELTLADGRILWVPISWSHRLERASQEQRANVVVLADGKYLSWPDVDEDIDVAALLKADELMDWSDDVALIPKLADEVGEKQQAL